MKVLVAGTGGGLAASGISTMADQMVRTLEAMGHEATRVVVGEHARARPNRVNVENVAAGLGDVMVLGRATLRNRPDLVWVHAFGVPTLPALRLLGQVLAVRLTGRPVIAHMHAFALAEHVRLAGTIQRWTLRLVGILAKHVVVLQDVDAAALSKVVRMGNVTVVNNWVDVPDALPMRPAPPPVVIAFVGTLTARKGVGPLLDAIRGLCDEQLIVRIIGGVGDEGERVAHEFRRHAEDLVERGVVAFVGPVPARDVRRELRAAHLLVLPSRAEGMPVVVLEALAEGCPVLVGDAGELSATVPRSGAGWVLEGLGSEDIAAELRRIVRSPTLLSEASKAGHRLATERYGETGAIARISPLLRS